MRARETRACACLAEQASVLSNLTQNRGSAHAPETFPLFGADYDSRLAHELDARNRPTYDDLWGQTRGKLNLHDGKHCKVLLDWLNQWNCRTAEASFPVKKARHRDLTLMVQHQHVAAQFRSEVALDRCGG